jgi:RNA polymerase sigma-70 factor (ECF subfamily)
VPGPESDRRLLQRCLQQEPDAWREFLDRYLRLIYHTVHHAAGMRSIPLDQDEIDDLAAEVLSQLVADDMAVLRRFRGKSTLGTYLAVISRRVVVNHLIRRQAIEKLKAQRLAETPPQQSAELRIENEEEVQRLLSLLDGRESELVRSFYLEGKSYREISIEMGIPENSIGPILARLRRRLRTAAPQT